MKTFSVMAIIGLIATTSAVDIPEYSEETFNAMGFTDVNSRTSVAATVINANLLKRFQRAIDTEVNAMSFFATSNTQEQTPQGSHPECGNALGINLRGDTNYCKLDAIRVNFFQTGRSNLNSLTITLCFAHGSERPLVLEVPIFKIPRPYASDRQALLAWAARQKVGINFPFSREQLRDNQENISIGFTWLAELLSYGLYNRIVPITTIEHDQERLVDSYVTHPIVLSVDKLEELKSAFSWIMEDLYVEDSVRFIVEPR